MIRKSLLLSLVFLIVTLSQAFAQLNDFGQVSTVNGFPQWYRDQNNVALELCLSAAQSTNLLNPGPMCITDAAPILGGGGQGLFNPLAPVTFPTNFPTNPIYFDANAQMPDQTQQLNPLFLYNAQYTATLMGGFGPGGVGITPIAGAQTTLAFITIQADAPIAGTYTVTHPYGTQTFNVTLPGQNAIVFSQLVPVAPAVGNFTGALASPIGPFLKWTPTLPPAIGTEQFIGDPNVAHAVTGSPTGNNFFRVAGPVGSNLDGAGGTTVTTNLFNISGKLATVPITVSSLTAAPASPQNAGASVTFTAAAGGGAGPLEYQFTRTLGTTPTVVQAYSANPAWTWNTASAASGTYAVRVDVRQVGTTTPVVTQSVNYTINGGTPAPVTISSLTANPASPQNVGTSVTFTAAATGGTAALEYQFTRTIGATSTVVQAYSTSPSWTWNTTGATAGSYTVKVDVRQTGATASAANQSLPYTINTVTPSPVTISSFTANPPSPQPSGTSVTFTAAASGGTGSLEYRFMVGTSVVQPYSTNASWTWNTTRVAASTYPVQVDVRQTGTTASAATQSLNYTIGAQLPAVTISSLTANPASPQTAGTTVNFATVAAGGTGTLEYRYTLGTTVVRPYSTNASWSWNTTGVAAGAYSIKVDVRQAASASESEATQSTSYTVTAPQPPPVTISSLAATPASPQTAGTTVNFTAAATGGTGSLEYRFTLGTTVVQAYSTNPSWTWNTTGLTAGAYSVKVDVRSVGSAVDSAATQSLSYTVNAPAPPPVTISSLAATPASPQTAGTTVNFATVAAGGAGTLEYRYTLGTAVVRAYSTSPSWSWNTTGVAAGTYNVKVDVRQVGSATDSAATQSASYTINAPAPPAMTISSLTATPVSPQTAGAAVTFTTAASGGTGGIEYRYTLGNRIVRQYSSSPSWTWMSRVPAGTYTVKVDVRQWGSTTDSEATQTMSFSVNPPSQPSGSGPTLTMDPNILKPVIDPVPQPKFVNPLTDVLAPDYVFSPSSGPNSDFDYFRISMTEFSQSVGLRDDTASGYPLLNPVKVWGYGDARGSDAPSGRHSYPGPTFLRKSTLGPNPDKPIKVVWTNEIPGGPDYHLMALAHPSEPALVALDTTMMCGRNAPYCRPFQRLIPHVHGGHNFDYSDGIPEEWFSPEFKVIGTQFWTPPEETLGTFTYPLDQTMANLWYHDHATGITRLNVQSGLVGEFVLRDQNELDLINANVLPKYVSTDQPYEQLLVVQDKTFVWNADTQTPAIAMPDIPLSDPKKTDPDTGQPCVQGSMNPACWVRDPETGKAIPSITPEFFGNMILVNGQTWPFKNVEPRKYRMRLLDATDSRTFFFRLENRSTVPPTPLDFIVIGTEQGLLPVPKALKQIILMPGERIDTVIDFTGLEGAEIVMTNVGPEGPFSPTTPVDTANPPADPVAPPQTTGQIVKFIVDRPLSSYPNATVAAGVPLQGGIIPDLPAGDKPPRELIMQELTDQYGRLILKVNGMGYLDPTTEIPALDSIETWNFVNLTADVHPMHIHLVKFQVVNRQDLVQPVNQTDPPTRYTLLDTFPPVRPEELGWKDTVQSYPDQVTRVRAKYDIPGIFIFHCHILSHEDYDKMRHYVVVMDPTGADLELFRGPAAQPASSPEPVIFHARGLTGLNFPLPPQSHGFEFQFSVKHPVRGWKVVQPYSDASNFIWIPTAGTLPGTYIVRVDLRIPTTTTPLASAEISYLLYGEPPKTMTISPANASLPAAPTGAKVTFSANASPAGNYEYRFRLIDASQNSTTVQDFSTNMHWTWTPPAVPAVYTVAVDARALGSTGSGAITATTTFTVTAKSPASVTLSRTGSSQRASSSPNPVTFTANALPAGQYVYRFSVKDPVNGWSVGDYVSANTFTWTPPANRTGLFTIQVEVRPAGSTARPTVAVAGYSVL